MWIIKQFPAHTNQRTVQRDYPGKDLLSASYTIKVKFRILYAGVQFKSYEQNQ